MLPERCQLRVRSPRWPEVPVNQMGEGRPGRVTEPWTWGGEGGEEKSSQSQCPGAWLDAPCCTPEERFPTQESVPRGHWAMSRH